MERDSAVEGAKLATSDQCLLEKISLLWNETEQQRGCIIAISATWLEQELVPPHLVFPAAVRPIGALDNWGGPTNAPKSSESQDWCLRFDSLQGRNPGCLHGHVREQWQYAMCALVDQFGQTHAHSEWRALFLCLRSSAPQTGLDRGWLSGWLQISYICSYGFKYQLSCKRKPDADHSFAIFKVFKQHIHTTLVMDKVMFMSIGA